MDNEKVNEILLKLLEDVAVIRAKLDIVEEIKMDTKTINTRIDHLEAQNREHDKAIKSLENRNNTMEEFIRSAIVDTKKQQTSTMLSISIAVLSAILSFAFSLL